MLWFERQVVGTLMSPTLDGPARSAVESYVSTTLQSMPEHLRAGVVAESIALGSRVVARVPDGPARPSASGTRVARWKTSKIDPVRQYVRLLQSLVLFAENELVPDGGA